MEKQEQKSQVGLVLSVIGFLFSVIGIFLLFSIMLLGSIFIMYGILMIVFGIIKSLKQKKSTVSKPTYKPAPETKSEAPLFCPHCGAQTTGKSCSKCGMEID